MKKTLFITIFFFLTTFSFSCQNDDEQKIKKIDSSFYHSISQYQSFNENKFDEYFQYFTNGYGIIHTLNIVNHPNFLTLSAKQPALYSHNQYLVNKFLYLDDVFLPNNLCEVSDISYIRRDGELMLADQDAFHWYQKMLKDANFLGINLVLFSAYRSFSKQEILYSNATNLNYIAYPGHSEHQTGMAFDISTSDAGLTEHFENTHGFLFLKDNAHKYGFIMRYPKDKTNITGYPYEPWHFRYVGAAATTIYEKNLTFEEYWYQNIEIIF